MSRMMALCCHFLSIFCTPVALNLRVICICCCLWFKPLSIDMGTCIPVCGYGFLLVGVRVMIFTQGLPMPFTNPFLVHFNTPVPVYRTACSPISNSLVLAPLLCPCSHSSPTTLAVGLCSLLSSFSLQQPCFSPTTAPHAPTTPPPLFLTHYSPTPPSNSLISAPPPCLFLTWDLQGAITAACTSGTSPIHDSFAWHS